METKNPLRKFGLFKMKCMSVAKVQFKGKQGPGEKLVIAFCDDQDRWIDANFILPMNDYTKGAYNGLLKTAGVTKVQDLKDKTLVVLIAPQEMPGGKCWWNPKKYFPGSYAKYLTEGSADDPFGMDEAAPPHTDDEFAGL